MFLMKKWLFISIIFFVFIAFGAVVYAAGLFNGAKSVANASAYAPCPYTSTIPNYVPPQTYNYAPTYNPAPIYNPPAYQAQPSYNSAPTYPSYQTNQTASIGYIPSPSYANLVLYCNGRGYQPNPSMTACVPVQIPSHAHLSIWGSTYDCDPGYNSLGDACVADPYAGQYPY
jgi:hypothetical protein